MADPGQWLVQGSSDLWTNAGSQAERALNLGWIRDQLINSTGGFTTNATPSTAAAFISTGDGTTGSGNSFYALGRRIWVNHGGASTDNTYAEISAAALAGGQTTVTIANITNGATALSTSAITSAAVGPTYSYSTDGRSPFPETLALSSGGPTRPSLHWGSATGAGVYSSSSGIVAISIAGATTFQFGSTYLAIGATPASAGNIRNSNNALISWRDSANTYDVDIAYTSTDGWRTRINAATVMLITAAAVASISDVGTVRDLRTQTADGTGHVAANSRVWGTT